MTTVLTPELVREKPDQLIPQLVAQLCKKTSGAQLFYTVGIDQAMEKAATEVAETLWYGAMADPEILVVNEAEFERWNREFYARMPLCTTVGHIPSSEPRVVRWTNRATGKFIEVVPLREIVPGVLLLLSWKWPSTFTNLSHGFPIEVDDDDRLHVNIPRAIQAVIHY